MKRKKISANYCRVVLPNEGDVIDLGDTVLTVSTPVNIKANGKINGAEFSLEDKGQGIRLIINLQSEKPFRKK